MKTNRRTILGLIGMAPVAGPAAARAIAENTAANLAGVALRAGSTVYGPATLPCNPSHPTDAHTRLALKIPAVRKHVRELLAEEQRGEPVYRIDPDLAVYRSFSLNAKIVFQRQRNIERRLEGMASEPARVWERIAQAVFKAVGISPGA
jgi:hypothetical protein